MDISRMVSNEKDEYVDLSELNGSMSSSVAAHSDLTTKSNVIGLRQFLQNKQEEMREDLNNSRYHGREELKTHSINDDGDGDDTYNNLQKSTSAMDRSMMSSASFINKIDQSFDLFQVGSQLQK